MKNASVIQRVIGSVMILLGVILFALSIKVNSGYGFRLYRFGNVNIGGVLIVLMIFEVVGYIALYNIQPWMKILKWVMIGTAIAFAIVFIVSLNFYFTNMNLLQFVLYLTLIGIGAGLLIRGRLSVNKNCKEEKKDKGD